MFGLNVRSAAFLLLLLIVASSKISGLSVANRTTSTSGQSHLTNRSVKKMMDVSNIDDSLFGKTQSDIMSGSYVVTTTKGPRPKLMRNTGISPLYRLRDSRNRTCILLKMDALLEVSFTSYRSEESVYSFVPLETKIDGFCNENEEAQLKLSWKSYELTFDFSKTPGGERWYVSVTTLRINTDDKDFHNIAAQGHYLSLMHTNMLFPTPVGRSYICPNEHTIDLSPDEFSPFSLRAQLVLRDVRMQPFIYKSDFFDSSFECSILQNLRDETVPFIFGAIMMLAIGGTVGAYWLKIYFVQKNVHYNICT